MNSFIKTITSVLFVGLIFLQACNKGANSKKYTNKDLNDLEKTLDSLSASKTPEALSQLKSTLHQMLNSPNEEVILKSLPYFDELENNRIDLDSVNETLLKRFPKGVSAMRLKGQEIWNKEDPNQMKAVYNEMVLEFPPHTFLREDRRTFNIFLLEIASKYLYNNNYSKAEQIVSEFIEEPYLSFNYYKLANTFHTQGNNEKAYEYLDKSLATAAKELAQNKISMQIKQSLNYNIQDARRLYALTLFEEKKYKEAIPFFEQIKKGSDNDDEVLLKYTQALSYTNAPEKALEELEHLIYKDFGSQQEYKLLEAYYVQMHKSLDGFSIYKEAVAAKLQTKILHKIEQNIINEPIANLALVNIYGKKIALNELVGKVVVLDFWATWCKPCIQSFPAMQNIKNFYKTDKEIEFLFINTLEFIENEERLGAIKKILMESNCPEFDVYLDQNKTGDFELATQLEVSAIPLKIIIGKNGNIRYKSLGYDGETEVEENKMKAIINKVKSL